MDRMTICDIEDVPNDEIYRMTILIKMAYQIDEDNCVDRSNPNQTDPIEMIRRRM